MYTAVLSLGKHFSASIIFERMKPLALETVRDFELRAREEAARCWP